MLGLLVVGILIAGGSPGYAQGPDPGTIPALAVNGMGPEVVPIETRAWAHDDFGRIVFDWPWAVAYGARIEGKTLTVMFDRRLHTTLQQIPRRLGAYITGVSLGLDGQSVVASLTGEYRLRTFLLNDEDGGVKVVVDLLADGEAGPVLAQAPTPLPAEPSPEAVPGDASSPIISGDSLLSLVQAPPEGPPAAFPPGLPFAVEADTTPETAPESGAQEHPLLGGVPRQRRGGSTDAPSSSPAPNGEPTAEQDADQAAVPPSEAVPEPEPAKGNPPRPFDELRTTPPRRGSEEAAPPAETAVTSEAEATSEEASSAESDAAPESVAETASVAASDSSPPIGVRASSPQAAKMAAPPGSERGEEGDTPPVKADAETPPAESGSTPESAPTAEATPPVEETAASESGGNPPRPSATPPRRGSEEAVPPAETAVTSEAEATSEEASSAESDAAPESVAETTPVDAPPAEPTPETVSEETPQTETATSPHPDPLPEGEGEVAASTPDAPSEETAAVIEDTSSTETAATTEDTPSTETAESPTPSPQFPTLPVSVRIPVSQSQLFRLDTPVASVFVANPEIADVQLVSSGVLFVVAKAVGRTSVAALDADSELVGEWTIATVLDIQPARAALEGVPALKNVVVRQLNRGVELSGPVASIAEADLALRLTTTALPEETPVENRISVTGKQQINLEVQIAEVQRSVSETLGFNWEVMPDIGGGRGLAFRVGRTFLDDAGAYLVNSLPAGTAAHLAGSTGVSTGRTTVRGLIDALASAGLATVLARPNVTAVSGETASFFSGGEYPLPAGFEDGAIIFEYKKYGVLLDFVPTIIDSGRIMLTVRPEVSQRSDTDSLTVTGIDIPVINVRRAETTVEVGDGESIVIAGLYRDQSEATEAGLPVVKDIPLLGMLFGTQSVRSNATELIVVVTARLTAATVMPRTTDRDRQLPGRRLRGYHY